MPNTKVVFSLYDEEFKTPFNENFASKLLLKGVYKKDLASLKSPLTYETVMKLAIDFSDGIIIQGQHVNENLIQYAKDNGKLILPYQEKEVLYEACNNFYDTVLSQEEENDNNTAK